MKRHFILAALLVASLTLGGVALFHHAGHGRPVAAAASADVSPTPGPLYNQPRGSADLSLDPTTGTPFVPTGADPAALAAGGVVLTPAHNLTPPVSTYGQALQDMANCDVNVTQMLSNAGYTHVLLSDMNGGNGSPYDADAWAFAVIPGAYMGDQWSFWFIDANDGTCRGASGGVASGGAGGHFLHMPEVP